MQSAVTKAHLCNLQDKTKELPFAERDGSIAVEARIAKQRSSEMQLSQIAAVLLNSFEAFVSPVAKQKAQDADSGLHALEPGEGLLLQGLHLQLGN